MSHEAAETAPGGGVAPEFPVTAPKSAATGWEPPEVHPQAPLFTAAVDQAWGTVRVRGHLDRAGVEMLDDILVGLQRSGHRHVTVQLRRPATVDAEARRLLADLAEQLATDGLQLDVQ
jgi:hypothetical protein